MNLGFVSAILADQSFEEVIDFASDNNFSCVEFMCWPRGKAERRYAGVTHIDILEMNQDKASRILDELNNKNVSISGLGYYPNPLSPNEEERSTAISHLKKLIKAAELINVEVVNTFIGRDWRKNLEENWILFKQIWPPIIKLAEDHGIKIAIENCPMLFSEDEWPGGKNLAHSPSIWKRMFEEIPSDSFGLNFDPSHLVWLGIDYRKAIREFASKIFHVHAKDVRIDPDKLYEVGYLAYPLQYHTPKLPGLGDVNWSMFFSELSDTGYDGPVCIEVEDRAYEKSLETRKSSLTQSGRFLKQYL
ncbi:MAG: sugar phosphate isomerase/epimerase [Bacteroidales bacterium]|nr:sugar phosphate isomerase/epimerase [Bacteroidales bacterium]